MSRIRSASAIADSNTPTVNLFSTASRGKFTGNGPLLCTKKQALVERRNSPWQRSAAELLTLAQGSNPAAQALSAGINEAIFTGMFPDPALRQCGRIGSMCRACWACRVDAAKTAAVMCILEYAEATQAKRLRLRMMTNDSTSEELS